MTHKILIADDEQHILDSVTAYFEESGFVVLTASNGREALYTFRHEQPDLIILDVMMPEMDGLTAAQLIRKESAVPLFFLTARVDDIDRVAGLEIGADEYITKPFSPRVLVAQARAMLRRVHGELAAQPTIYRVGDLELNADTHTFTQAGQRIELTPIEFDLLAALMARPGRVFTRLELLDHVRDQAYAAYERAIDVHIKNLRAKIEADSRNPQYIETVYGIGYRMRESV
ncbi:MAG: response regulator transcription factor [Anaerolineales bacterium]|nr:response regulator transcription factor [Anaerolineales bacterium]